MTLDEEIREILRNLQLLANGATQNLDPDKRFSKHADSAAPSGVALRSSAEAPPKDKVSLFEWYRWQFEHNAADPRMLAVLLDLAKDDYRDFRFKADALIEVRKGERVENDPHDPGAADRAQAERVISWYEGRDPLYVAYRESEHGAKVSEEWVRKARRDHGRNEHDGRPDVRSAFLDLDEEDRRRKVASLANRGLSQQKAADRLRVSKFTVQRYWPEPVAA